MLDCPACGGKFDDPKGRIEGAVRVRHRTCQDCGARARTVEPVRCPNCGSEETVYSGTTQDFGTTVTRYRQCSKCVHTFRTYEDIELFERPIKKRKKHVSVAAKSGA